MPEPMMTNTVKPSAGTMRAAERICKHLAPIGGMFGLNPDPIAAIIERETVQERASWDICAVCAGTGDPGNGKECICGGTGRGTDEVAELRKLAFRLEDEAVEQEGTIRELTKQVAELREALTDTLEAWWREYVDFFGADQPGQEGFAARFNKFPAIVLARAVLVKTAPNDTQGKIAELCVARRE